MNSSHTQGSGEPFVFLNWNSGAFRKCSKKFPMRSVSSSRRLCGRTDCPMIWYENCKRPSLPCLLAVVKKAFRNIRRLADIHDLLRPGVREQVQPGTRVPLPGRFLQQAVPGPSTQAPSSRCRPVSRSLPAARCRGILPGCPSGPPRASRPAGLPCGSWTSGTAGGTGRSCRAGTRPVPAGIGRAGNSPSPAPGCRCIERGGGAFQHHGPCTLRAGHHAPENLQHCRSSFVPSRTSVRSSSWLEASRPPCPEGRCLGERVAPWHQVGPAEALPEVVKPQVQRAARPADIHQEVFAGRADAVQPGLVRDLLKRVLVGVERDPGCPGEGAPVVEEVRDLFGVERGVGMGGHLLHVVWSGMELVKYPDSEKSHSAGTATNEAEEWDFGTGIPSSINPWTCIPIASCIRSSASSRSCRLPRSPGGQENRPNNFFLLFLLR